MHCKGRIAVYVRPQHLRDVESVSMTPELPGLEEHVSVAPLGPLGLQATSQYLYRTVQDEHDTHPDGPVGPCVPVAYCADGQREFVNSWVRRTVALEEPVADVTHPHST